MRRTTIYIAFAFLFMGYAACKSKSNSEEHPGEAPETVIETPVTVISVTPAPLVEYIELNATSAFLQSNIVKASANGYIKSIAVTPGQFVPSGKTIFSIQTKESTNI